MKQLKHEITYEMGERTYELSLIMKKTSQLNDNYINKFFLVAIYANWEAFIKNSIEYYINYLDKHNLLKDSYYTSLIINYEGFLERNLSEPEQIKSVLDLIDQIKTNPTLNSEKIKFKIMNFDNTNKLLKRFNIPEFNKKNRIQLNTLVKHRNWIAHGKQEICLNDINTNKIREYINLIEEMMNEFILNINQL